MAEPMERTYNVLVIAKGPPRVVRAASYPLLINAIKVEWPLTGYEVQRLTLRAVEDDTDDSELNASSAFEDAGADADVDGDASLPLPNTYIVGKIELPGACRGPQRLQR